MTGPASLADLFGALAGAPSLPGARCRGRPHLFDPPHPEEAAATTAARHAQALALCQRCPSLDRCGQWLDSLRPRDRPTCVIAARIHRNETTERQHSMTRPDPTNIAVLPADQRRAAELTEACIGGDGDRFGDLLVELVDAGPERALAVTAVLARNLAVSLAAAHGPDEAVRVLQCTRFDAALADTDDDE